jgi:hypothetical protein
LPHYKQKHFPITNPKLSHKISTVLRCRQFNGFQQYIRFTVCKSLLASSKSTDVPFTRLHTKVHMHHIDKALTKIGLLSLELKPKINCNSMIFSFS